MTALGEATRLQVSGVDLEIRQTGSGRPLLFLHGGGGPETAGSIPEALVDNFRVLVPSHPGFGHSSLPDSFDSVHDLAYFYLDVIDALDLDDVVLAGHSFGAWIAAETAVRCCDRLSRLVLIDPIGIKTGDRESRDIADIFAVSPEQLDALRFHDPARAPSSDPASLSDDELAVIARNNESLALFIWQPYAHNPKLRQRLHRVSVPTLLVWGESDGIVSTDYGAAYRDAIPGSRLAVIPKAGHLPQIEQPDAFLRVLRDFLREGEQT